MLVIKNFCFISLLISVFLVVSVSNVIAGAWTLPQGKSQFIITAYSYTTNDFYNSAGTKSPVNRFSKIEIIPYYEYGLRDWLTIGVSDAFQHLKQDDAFGVEQSNNGETGVELFSRARIWQNDNFVVSLGGLVKAPAHYAHNVALVGGHDNYDIAYSILGGYSFRWFGRHHYIDSSLGYRHRLGVLHDQLQTSIGAGFDVGHGFKIMPSLDYTGAVNADLSSASAVSGQNDYHLAKAQLSVLYKINEAYSVQIGGYSHIHSRNTGGGSGYLLGLWRKF